MTLRQMQLDPAEPAEASKHCVESLGRGHMGLGLGRTWALVLCLSRGFSLQGSIWLTQTTEG